MRSRPVYRIQRRGAQGPQISKFPPTTGVPPYVKTGTSDFGGGGPWPPCPPVYGPGEEEVGYRVTFDRAALAAASARLKETGELGEGTREMTGDLTMVELYYPILSVVQYTSSPKMLLSDLFADVGALLNFWLGNPQRNRVLRDQSKTTSFEVSN